MQIAPSMASTMASTAVGRRRVMERTETADVGASDRRLARVAGLLISISRNNGYEGRDPATLPDALSSEFVADMLGVDIATLAALLVDLRRRGIVECGPESTLHLNDIDALERLAS